jgi:hypothetical protein
MVVDRDLYIVLILDIKVGFKLGTVLDRKLRSALSAIAIIPVLVTVMVTGVDRKLCIALSAIAIIPVSLEIPIIITGLVMENITL